MPCFPPGLLHVIDITGVGHLLNVNARLLLGASDSSDDSLLDDVLQVGKSTPDVPKVLEGVRPGTRIPIAAEGNVDENKKLSNQQRISDTTGAGHSLIPVFNLVRPLHIVNVHTDLVVDVGRQLSAVAMGDVRKHDSSPEPLVVQKTHGLIDQPLLISHWLQFVQVHALRGKDNGVMACLNGHG